MGESSMDDANVKVAVRVRPMNRREKELNTKCVVEMLKNQTILHPNLSKADSRSQSKVFAYDYCFWSMDETDKEKFAGQEVVFQCLGESLLHNAFQGYNACIFAYGQTGSGKSYTMMGSVDQPGLIPRLCSALFDRTQKEQREEESFTVEVSYMEIYNEKVRDLLDPKGGRQTLRVREHKVLGPYVDGLSRLAVASYKDIESLMSEGNKSRTVAATNMNEESSRSHAVFNIILTHTLKDLKSGMDSQKEQTKIHQKMKKRDKNILDETRIRRRPHHRNVFLKEDSDAAGLRSSGRSLHSRGARHTNDPSPFQV